jgi:voltage-gated potassium channel
MADLRKISFYLGAAGVAPTENHLARRVGVIFELPMLVAALGILLRWWGESSNVDVPYSSLYFDIFLWSFFVIESMLLSFLVSNIWCYLKGNWLNLVIIVLGSVLFFGWEFQAAVLRILRFLIVFSLLIHVGNRVRKMLSRNELGTTLIASVIVIIMSGLIMAVLEPGIESPIDGIWWAWVTVTTVGYGDVVPATTQGRLFASLVILMGIGLFAMLTATFAAFFISQKEDEVLTEEREQYRKISDIEDRLYTLENKIDEVIAALKDQSK